MVLGQYGAIGVGTFWYWASIGWYCSVLCGTGSVLSGTKVYFKNLDQTSATGLVWQGSVKKGKAVRLLERLHGSLHTKVTSVRESGLGSNENNFFIKWSGMARKLARPLCDIMMK